MLPVFAILDLITLPDNICPGQFSSFMKKLHFESLRDIFSFSNFFKKNLFFVLCIVRCIAFWNSAAISARP